MRVTVNASLSVQASKLVAWCVDGVVVDEDSTQREIGSLVNRGDLGAFAEKQEPVWRARCIISAPWMKRRAYRQPALSHCQRLWDLSGRSVALRWVQRASGGGCDNADNTRSWAVSVRQDVHPVPECRGQSALAARWHGVPRSVLASATRVDWPVS